MPPLELPTCDGVDEATAVVPNPWEMPTLGAVAEDAASSTGASIAVDTLGVNSNGDRAPEGVNENGVVDREDGGALK